MDHTTFEKKLHLEMEELCSQFNSVHQRRVQNTKDFLEQCPVISQLASEVGNPTFTTSQGWNTFTTKIHSAMMLRNTDRHHPINLNSTTPETEQAVCNRLIQIFDIEKHDSKWMALNIRAQVYPQITHPPAE